MEDFSFISLHFSLLDPFSFVITYTLGDFETSAHLLSVVVKRVTVTALRKDLPLKDTRLDQLFLSVATIVSCSIDKTIRISTTNHETHAQERDIDRKRSVTCTDTKLYHE